MIHKPVLLNEVIEQLNIKPNGIYVDLTLGGAGHSFEILKRLNEKGKLIAFDQDQYAIEVAKEKLKDFSNVTIFHANFKDLKEKLTSIGITKVDGVLMDLGMSSFQIDDPSRGFSYMQDGPLDMRMSLDSPLTAYEILNTYSKEQLIHIFRTYGQEPNSVKIANEIIKNRPLKTTFDLVRITDLMRVKGHSAKRVFQALRIYINSELVVLENVLPVALSLLNKDGVLAAITFHSLEDRIVKNFIKEHAEEKVIKGLPAMPKEMPLRYAFKKFIKPTQQEILKNPRAKSALLRVAVKN